MAPAGLGRALWVQLSPEHQLPGAPRAATLALRPAALPTRLHGVAPSWTSGLAPGTTQNTCSCLRRSSWCCPAPRLLCKGTAAAKPASSDAAWTRGPGTAWAATVRHQETQLDGRASGFALCHRKRPHCQPAPSAGASWRGGPPFPLGPVPRRQRAGGGGRSSELQPTGPLTSASHCPHDPPHERHAGRRTRASGAQAGNAGRRALPELSKPSCASGPCRQQPAPRRAQRDRGDTSLPLRPLDPDPGYGGGHTCPWWGRPPPDLGPRVWPTTPVRISSTPTSGAWGAGARPGRGAARGRRGWPQARNWVLLNRTHPARSREGCARPLPGLLGGQPFCHSGQRLTC